MISKKLLSKIYPDTMEHCFYRPNIIDNKPVLISRLDEDKKPEVINIHELAHKCKEWAYNKNYWISSGYAGDIEISDVDVSYPTKTLQTGLTEPEAVFEACEWVLEQEEKG